VIPDELIEAASLGWCVRLEDLSATSFFRFCAPMSAALGNYQLPLGDGTIICGQLIVVNNQDKFTLQLSLANLVGTNTVEWGTLLAYAISGADSGADCVPPVSTVVLERSGRSRSQG